MLIILDSSIVQNDDLGQPPKKKAMGTFKMSNANQLSPI